eukprot:363762-Chlamydomonas_euryale.AAC.4
MPRVRPAGRTKHPRKVRGVWSQTAVQGSRPLLLRLTCFASTGSKGAHSASPQASRHPFTMPLIVV